MKIVKRTLEILAIIAILFLSMGAFAADKPTAKNNKYEVKSDILNFNYEEMSYPSQLVSIGIHIEDKPLVARKPGKQLTNEERLEIKIREIKNGIGDLLQFAFILVGAIGLFVMLPTFIAHFILWLRRQFKPIDKKIS